MTMTYHVNDAGEVKRCVAKTRECKYGIHAGSPREAEAVYERQMQDSLIKTHVRKPPDLVKSFSKDDYYGDLPPRSIQLGPLNEVTEELDKSEATQLVAACGTGKTFMHRQLLNHYMTKPDSNGVGVLLTSSIRLAHDTAADLRPTGGYDHSLGDFGEDYEVIEVHSDARGHEGRQSVRDGGVISVDRIYSQLDAAKRAGKKVVIVSTYDSVSKVQEAQERFEDQGSVEADILIHDEAHNILGQQRPTVVASDENELTAYVGFHNAIPGAVQAKKRLYSTATPVMKETDSEKAEAENLEAAIAAAERMRAGDQKERVTVYSDHELVGRVSGFISQNEAVENQYLAEPVYSIRKTSVKGSVSDFQDPVVRADGTLQERGESEEKYPLEATTYGAINSTLDAMVADPATEEENVSHNALVYAGSIKQAEAYRSHFAAVALHRSGGMELTEAEKLVDSDDADLKKRARFRLLAEHAQVRAAHSSTDSEAVKERRAAFDMFHGNAAVSNQWTPRKKILANVDIFSEGVSIPEIDTVVISDNNKLNEKAMTQAIGRAIRVVPGNDYKKYGHVVIPSVTDSSGSDLTASSINMATYTATRVERGSTASKLRGEQVQPDEKTTFRVHSEDGANQEVKARDFAQNSVTDLKDLAAASELKNNHIYLLQKDPNYSRLSRKEQFEVRKSRVFEKLDALKKDSPRKRYLQEVSAHLEGKSLKDVRDIERNGRVLSAALATGDISSINKDVAARLLEEGVLKTTDTVRDFTPEEKKEFLKSYKTEFAYGILTQPPGMSDSHSVANSMMSAGMNPREKTSYMRDGMSAIRFGKETPATQDLNSRYEKLLEDPEFVDHAFQVFGADPSTHPPAINNSRNNDAIKEKARSVLEALKELKHAEAEQGVQTYTVDSGSVKKTGELTVGTLTRLIS